MDAYNFNVPISLFFTSQDLLVAADMNEFHTLATVSKAQNRIS